MSPIAGFICLGDGPRLPEVPRGFSGLVRDLMPENQCRLAENRGLLCHFSLETETKDSKIARVSGASDSSILLFDGRIHNRDELLGFVELPLDQLRNCSDSVFVLHFLRQNGMEACSRLIGDFAFAFWQRHERKLWLVRDALGGRPLYWHFDERKCLTFATSPVVLHAVRGVRPGLDEGVLHDVICGLPLTSDRTLFGGTYKVRSGGIVEFSGAGPKACFHHRFDPRHKLASLRSAEFADLMREKFEESVASRLTPSVGFSSQLSSGLDSSAVTVIASKLLIKQGRNLHAFTAVPRRGFGDQVPKGFHGNEAQLARLTARGCPGLVHAEVPTPELCPIGVLRKMVSVCAFPPRNPLDMLWDHSICQAAKAVGSKAVLTGSLGNLSFSYDGVFYLSSLLGRLKWFRFAAELASVDGKTGRRALLKQALLPHRVGLRRLVSRPKAVQNWNPMRYAPINPAFARDIAATTDFQNRFSLSRYRPWLDGREMRAEYFNRHDSGELHLWDAANGLERSDPTGDRRFVEFCLALPESQFWRRGEQRHVFSRAFEGILPAEVLGARSAGYQSADWAHTATEALPAVRGLLEESADNQMVREYIDLDVLRAAVASWPVEGWDRASVISTYKVRLFWGLSLCAFLCYASQ